jgi:metal-responsive CopG/Arc/MetJ family transcriptional regulator
VDIGIKKEPVRRSVSVQLDESVLEVVDRLAAEQRRSRSNLIEWMLTKSIEFGMVVISGETR